MDETFACLVSISGLFYGSITLCDNVLTNRNLCNVCKLFKWLVHDYTPCPRKKEASSFSTVSPAFPDRFS